MMRKWQKLHWMSSALPLYKIPRTIVDFGNTDGSDQLMYASDFPGYSLGDGAAEMEPGALFEEHVIEKYAWKNAQRVFFDK